MEMTMKYFRNICISIIHRFVDKTVFPGILIHAKSAHLNQTSECLDEANILLFPKMFIIDKIIITEFIVIIILLIYYKSNLPYPRQIVCIRSLCVYRIML